LSRHVALGGNAGESYRDYQEWLGARELVVERLPYLSAALDGTFGKADLLLALDAGAVSAPYLLGRDAVTVSSAALHFASAMRVSAGTPSNSSASTTADSTSTSTGVRPARARPRLHGGLICLPRPYW
jgi:hypothetical protein